MALRTSMSEQDQAGRLFPAFKETACRNLSHSLGLPLSRFSRKMNAALA